MAVEDQEGDTGVFGNLAGCLPLRLLEVGGIDHHREAGMQRSVGQLMQALVGGRAGILVVDAGTQLVFVGTFLFAEQALALDIRAQANGAKGFDQAHGHVAFADRGNPVGDGQEA
ncbi:hypothetical protein FQZ97_1005210 [compost metagenome]